MSGFRVRPDYDTESDSDTDAYGADSDDDLDVGDVGPAPAPAPAPANLAAVRRPIIVILDGYAIFLVECRFVSSVFRAVLTLYDALSNRRNSKCYQQRRFYDKELYPCAVVNHLCLVVRCLEDPSGLEEGLLQAPLRVTLLHETGEPVADESMVPFREDELRKLCKHPVVWSSQVNDKYKPSSAPAPEVAYRPNFYNFFVEDLKMDANPATYARPRERAPGDDCVRPIVTYSQKDGCFYDVQRGVKRKIVLGEDPETLFRTVRKPPAA